MFGLCRCSTEPKIIFESENLQVKRIRSGAEINDIYVSKIPKLMIRAVNRTVPAPNKRTESIDTLVRFRKVSNSGNLFLAAPGRMDSGKGDNSNLSSTQVHDLSNINKSFAPPLLQSNLAKILIMPTLKEDVYVDDLQYLLEQGEELKRNSVTRNENFCKFLQKYKTGNKFSDYLGFRKYQNLKTTKGEAGVIIKARLPAHKVISMKEYRKSGRGRALSVSPKKSILTKRKQTIDEKNINISPARKQVTFSKHNTVLIFAKEVIADQ